MVPLWDRLVRQKNRGKASVLKNSADLGEWRLDTDRFLRVLKSMVSVAERLQNSSNREIPQPKEDLAARFVLAELSKYRRSGTLKIQEVSYAKGRSNLIITYPATSNGHDRPTVAFVGAHLDVVPADATQWVRPPFELQVENGRLFGRGVTDCLGHVAVLTDLFAQLAESQIELQRDVVAVIIADEELSNTNGVGIGQLVRDGRLDDLKNGPLYWIDSSDFGPTTATAGMALWRIIVSGKASHSGFPQNGINAVELANEVIRSLQEWFYAHYPAHPNEKGHGFVCPSSLKPTRVTVENDTLTKIPAKAVIEGDVRLTPWYDPVKVKEAMNDFLRNLSIDQLPPVGPASYSVEGDVGTATFDLLGTASGGMACDRNSDGYAALERAIVSVVPDSRPIAMTGTLPYVSFLQSRGFDVQITGFGRNEAYHAPNEFAELSDMQLGFQVLCRILTYFD